MSSALPVRWQSRFPKTASIHSIAGKTPRKLREDVVVGEVAATALELAAADMAVVMVKAAPAEWADLEALEWADLAEWAAAKRVLQLGD